MSALPECSGFVDDEVGSTLEAASGGRPAVVCRLRRGPFAAGEFAAATALGAALALGTSATATGAGGGGAAWTAAVAVASSVPDAAARVPLAAEGEGSTTAPPG